MQHIGRLAKSSAQQIKLHKASPSECIGGGEPTLIDYVWMRMAGMYGAKWTSSVGADPAGAAGKEWARALAGVGLVGIDAGIEACRLEGADWPPSAPRFLAMCLGVPSLGAVADEIAGRRPPSAFGQAVFQCLDIYAFRLASRDEAARMLRSAFDAVRDRVMAGGVLQPVAARIEEERERKPIAATKEAQIRYMNEISEILGVEGVASIGGITDVE